VPPSSKENDSSSEPTSDEQRARTPDSAKKEPNLPGAVPAEDNS